MMIASTPEPPYYAVIFSSVKNDVDKEYEEVSERMDELAKLQDGYLGMESARDGIGITVSYWKDLESIKKWKENAEHALARKKGREKWYSSFKVRVARVERDYAFSNDSV